MNQQAKLKKVKIEIEHQKKNEINSLLKKELRKQAETHNEV